MHSTQAVRIILAADYSLAATPVAIVACPVSDGTNPAWWIVSERQDARGSNFHVHRAIQREDGEVFFDCGRYDLTAHEAFRLLGEKVERTAADAAGDEVQFDHSADRPLSDQYAARIQ